MVTPEAMLAWCRQLLGVDGMPPPRHEDLLKAIGRLPSFDDLPRGSRVLLRGDVDEKPGPKPGDGDVRLRSMISTLAHGQQRGWVQIVCGHIGRKPEGTLTAVAARLGELLRTQVDLLGDWLDEATHCVAPVVGERIAKLQPGSVVVLENTRRYAIERVLWKATAAELPDLAPKLAVFSNSIADRIASNYVNEAFSAGSLDASTTVVPAAMRRVALGRYGAGEFDGPLQRCRQAQLVVFSGLKIDKLDDLEAILDRGQVRMILVAGSLAMALKKASAAAQGQSWSIGVAEDPTHSDKPYFIPTERIAQATRLLEKAAKADVEIVLPVDFVLQDGRVSSTIGPGDQQFDVGPGTGEHFAKKLDEFVARNADRRGGSPPIAFHNGVFGMFEDPRFEGGTRQFVGQLRRLKEAGLEVYVGGGEGGAALEKYGQPDWVTHCFTAGGTVLNALGAQPIPYLLAMAMAARRSP